MTAAHLTGSGRTTTATVTGEPETPVEIAPDRPFWARVARTWRLGPTFLRITFVLDAGADFGGHGFDQRINVILPRHAGDGFEAFPRGRDWYGAWRKMPVGSRNPIRTYTVRALRPDTRELDIDFVLHGDGGPACRWARSARPGDLLLIIGPDARHRGPVGDVAWCPPESPDRLLIAGDETAVPAISAIVESLTAQIPAQVVLEVPDPNDVLDLTVASGAAVTWLPRGHRAPPGHLLVPAVKNLVRDNLVHDLATAHPVIARDDGADELWEVPDRDAVTRDGFYAWLAGEAGMVTQLRRHLVQQVGIDRGAVAFMGYWRLGR
jgi:NADPH-dependent ferric siderophore reductase